MGDRGTQHAESTADNDIGIPNVPAIVWEYEKRRARERLDAGRCPVHNISMTDTGKEEICPKCEELR